MAINTDKLNSPHIQFIIYMVVSCILIMIFRFILPGSDSPLRLYSQQWRLIKGVLEICNLFPALAFSALVIPFGIYVHEANYNSFSDMFFKRLVNSVVIAIAAAVIYGIIFFLVFPMLKNREENIRYMGELYDLAKTHMQDSMKNGEWHEADQFLNICDHIWYNSPEIVNLRHEIEINLERIKSEELEEKYLAREALARDRRYDENTVSFEGQQLLNATQAITKGYESFNNKKYFEAHWLATIGRRLAERGSPDEANAARLASDAWNMISSLAPNNMEEHIYELFNLKLSGYQAMNNGEWIRAFYIFQELLAITPDDLDAVNFLTASEAGVKENAFFIDEMEVSLGEILTGALFSLPSNGGRVVLRFSSLTTSNDVSYGIGLEYMAFDLNFVPLASVKSQYAKLLPITIDEKPQVLILMHALNRINKDNYYDGEWLIGNKTVGGILIDISYEDLMLLSYIRRSLPNLQIDELYLAAVKFGNAGYVYQIFQAEILNRLSSTLFFLPMAILVIVLGWRYRIKSKSRYIFVIMLPVLPVVFHGLVFLYRSVFNTAGIWLILTVGFVPALIVFIAVMALILFISLITLAAQHN
ncbi:MAG: hypothetical protein LBC76_10775 [Treponema sp.]|jgi:hypothetical protein|nr:hypothetical protein [Treponema sp.]